MGATERVIQYINYKGISKYKFNKELGFSNKFLDNSSNMGTDKACKILHHYPDINSEWLLTGEGEMLKKDINIIEASKVPSVRKTSDALYTSQQVPLYNLEATMGLVPLMANNGVDDERIIDFLTIPNLPACDGSIYATGDSMYPLLKSGDIVAYKTINVDVNQIFFGEIYVLAILLDEQNTYKTIKFVQPSDLGTDFIKLVSHNQHHADKDIKLTQISAMALVRASIRLHN